MARYTGSDLIRLAESISKRTTFATRRKCFVSYHNADIDAVGDFLDDFGSVFIPKVVGIKESDPLIESTDRDYIMRKIREKYLTDSTVTIVLLGRCTWSRRFVDWEIASSLRNDPNNKRSGLLAIPLPPKRTSAHLPDRVKDNWTKGDSAASYAEFRSYPDNDSDLRRGIEAAFAARTDKSHLVDNSRKLFSYNRTCP